MELAEEFEVRTHLGDSVLFGPDVLQHWEEKDNSKKTENRSRFLLAVEDAIRFPHEI